MIFDKKVACGEFVKRQTPESGFSHFNGDWGVLEYMTQTAMKNGSNITPGYRDGVILVTLHPEMFSSAVVKLNSHTPLMVNYAPRREGESPYIRISAKAKKQRAKHASVVLYRYDILSENNERETNAEWEIVAIKARASREEEPMDPMTMARNFLHLAGGTKGDFSAEDFAKSIVYWNCHCMTAGRPRYFKRFTMWLRKLF